jgi:hypothetical protein
MILADWLRVEQFRLIGSTRQLFAKYTLHTDESGVPWAIKRIADLGFAFTWLGRGWVFDPEMRELWPRRYDERRRNLEVADAHRHGQELDQVRKQLQLGRLAERLLWAIHLQVLSARSSAVLLPDDWFAGLVWGGTRPRHWRQDLLRLLRALSWLHLGHWPGQTPPSWGCETALLTYTADQRSDPDGDVCNETCPGRLGPPHHHYRVHIGQGFLGVLEQFAQPDSSGGIRAYHFPIGGRQSQWPTLRKVGRTGRLVSIYLPAKLGDPEICQSFSRQQHRFLQSLVRETTRKRIKRGSPAEAEVVVGNRIPAFHGPQTVVCSLLDPSAPYVAFNGNGKRKGLGYKLTTPGGWLGKSGYSLDPTATMPLADTPMPSPSVSRHWRSRRPSSAPTTPTRSGT